MKQITIYACKNGRKNSKSIIKDFLISDKNKEDGLKKEFGINDLYDVADFCRVSKNKGYGVFRLCVFDNNFCVKNFYSGSMQTIEQVLNEVYYFMSYMQRKDFNFSLSELHGDMNIRYHINKFYW